MAKKLMTGSKDRKPVIGLPRALLYERYRVLWRSFFQELGAEVVISPPTTLETMERGTAIAIDEMCLSSKIFFGHVDKLIGKCDYILVPRISNFGVRRFMCTKFEGLYDVCRNIYRESDQKFLTYNVDVQHGIEEDDAFVATAAELGYARREARQAYKKAKKAESESWRKQVKKQEELYKKDGLKIMIASHSYVVSDPYIGKPITDFLEGAGVTVLRADITDRKDALKWSARFSPTMRWEISREITGGLRQNRFKVDGIILLSVFPCGPDAMVNEMLIRRNDGMPILNLMLDGQSGMAGVETRLESFVDILRLKRGEL
ncbi:MAG: acyl-CoA dehydratase activase-related protein [Clostridiales bacterium]|nr:acyl-CoA dehydratase activase-related protein [Clostridiales bacterium]